MPTDPGAADPKNGPPKGAPVGDLPEVPRVENPTVERFVADFLLPQKPAVFTGTFDRWPALARWDFDFLRQAVGSKRLRVEAVSGGDKPGYFGRSSLPQEIELGEYVARVVAAKDVPRLYMGGISVPGQLPEIAADLALPPYVQGGEKPVPYLWLGARGTTTQLHYDINNNFHALFRGRKRFILYAPDQSGCLYPTSLLSPRRHFSRVWLEAPDLERFPKFRGARGCQATLGPGDLLFLPSLWWHEVRTLEPSIAVNYWWGKNEYGNKRAYLYVRELPLIWWTLGKAQLRWRVRQLAGR